MANKRPNSVRNGIIVTVVGTVVGGVILSAIPKVRGFLVEAMSWIWAGVTWVWVALIAHYSMPGWAFLIIGIFGLVGLLLLCVFFWLQVKPENEPAYRSYTEDVLYGAKWRWSWNSDGLTNLWCFCPNCDAQLIYRESYGETDFICERCSPDRSDHLYRSYGLDQPHGRVVATVKGGDRYYAVGAAKREILRRIRTSENVPSNG